MSTWKVESEWVGINNDISGKERQRIRIEVQSCANIVTVYNDYREAQDSPILSEKLFSCDVIAARTIADLLVLNLVNYCGLNGRAAALIGVQKEALRMQEDGKRKSDE